MAWHESGNWDGLGAHHLAWIWADLIRAQNERAAIIGFPERQYWGSYYPAASAINTAINGNTARQNLINLVTDLRDMIDSDYWTTNPPSDLTQLTTAIAPTVGSIPSSHLYTSIWNALRSAYDQLLYPRNNFTAGATGGVAEWTYVYGDGQDEDLATIWSTIANNFAIATPSNQAQISAASNYSGWISVNFPSPGIEVEGYASGFLTCPVTHTQSSGGNVIDPALCIHFIQTVIGASSGYGGGCSFAWEGFTWFANAVVTPRTLSYFPSGDLVCTPSTPFPAVAGVDTWNDTASAELTTATAYYDLSSVLTDQIP